MPAPKAQRCTTTRAKALNRVDNAIQRTAMAAGGKGAKVP